VRIWRDSWEETPAIAKEHVSVLKDFFDSVPGVKRLAYAVRNFDPRESIQQQERVVHIAAKTRKRVADMTERSAEVREKMKAFLDKLSAEEKRLCSGPYDAPVL